MFFISSDTGSYEMISGCGASAALIILVCFLITKLISAIRGAVSQKVKLHNILSRPAPITVCESIVNPFFSGENEYAEDIFHYSAKTAAVIRGSTEGRMRDELAMAQAARLIDAYCDIEKKQQEDQKRYEREASALIAKLTAMNPSSQTQESPRFNESYSKTEKHCFQQSQTNGARLNPIESPLSETRQKPNTLPQAEVQLKSDLPVSIEERRQTISSAALYGLFAQALARSHKNAYYKEKEDEISGAAVNYSQLPPLTAPRQNPSSVPQKRGRGRPRKYPKPD